MRPRRGNEDNSQPPPPDRAAEPVAQPTQALRIAGHRDQRNPGQADSGHHDREHLQRQHLPAVPSARVAEIDANRYTITTHDESIAAIGAFLRTS